MLVAERSTGALIHARAADLPRFLDAGDVLVVNTSPTLPAAIPSVDGTAIVHLSTDLGGGRWVVEVRRPCGRGSRPQPVDHRQRIPLVGGAVVRPPPPVLARAGRRDAALVGGRRVDARPAARLPRRRGPADPLRLHRHRLADRRLPDGVRLATARRPRARLGRDAVGAAGRSPRSSSAALIEAGVVFAPITLHTGVSSLEAHEPPYAERYRVPVSTARLVNEARTRRAAGSSPSAPPPPEPSRPTPSPAGPTPATAGPELVITPERGLEVVDGIISGWHEPEASHLLLMEAVAGRPLLEASYRDALAERYRWHEFGDIHLVLP